MPRSNSYSTVLAVVIASLVVLLGGCVGGGPGSAPSSDGDDGDGTDPGNGPGPQAGAGLAKPAWSVGQHWTYAPADGDPIQLVVTQNRTDNGTDTYRVDTTSQAFAFEDARPDTPDVTLRGSIRADTLAGVAGDAATAWFRWPLQEGANWTTDWRDATLTVAVISVEDGTARLEARADDTVRAEYTYDADAKWFGAFTAYNATGVKIRSWTLQDAGTGFSGDVVRWDLQGDFYSGSPGGGLGVTLDIPSPPSEVPEGLTDIWVELHITCQETGGFAIGWQYLPGPQSLPGATPEHWEGQGACPGAGGFEGVAVASPAPGQFAFELQAVAPSPDNEMPVFRVAHYFRTLQTISVG